MNDLIAIGVRPAFFVPLIIIATLAVPGALMLVRYYKVREKISYYSSMHDSEGLAFGGYITSVCAAIMIVITALMFIPYQWQYAQMYRVSGEVTSVSNVLQDASGKLTSAPIVQLDTLPVSVALNNERAVGLEGKNVTLTCTLNWRYASADRLECDIYEVQR